MLQVIRSNSDAIASVCRRHGVQRLWLFGSAARADFDPTRSDVDFLVDFGTSELGPWMKRFFDLQADLELILGRRVDLVLASAQMGPIVARNVAQSRVPLYDAA